MFKKISVAVAIAALATAATAAATVCPPPKPPPPKQYHPPVKPPVVTPPKPPVTVPKPPVSQPVPPGVATPPVVVATAPVTGSHSNTLFCVQTTDYGWTMVQADDHSFDVGGAWRLLYNSGATVKVGNKTVTLAGLVDDPDGGSRGIMLAPFVTAPGYEGYRCDQPWVSNTTPAVIRTA